MRVVPVDMIVERVAGTCVACREDMHRGCESREDIGAKREDKIDGTRHTCKHAHTHQRTWHAHAHTDGARAHARERERRREGEGAGERV